jgi:undecaprenyl diphosphate synthase
MDLFSQIDLTKPPKHIAIIMDGNGRWASTRYLPRIAGHKQGVDALRDCVKACVDRGVRILTVFAFSSENWSRPKEEVSGLMDLLVLVLNREVPQLSKDGVRLFIVGDREGLSDKVTAGFDRAEALTALNTKLILNVCFNYGGRWDITQAARKLIEAGKPLTEINMDSAMALSHVPDPDLIIRTGGEQRISNFVLWQAAYSEMFFSDSLWPEFDVAELDRAIAAYRQRERRFGKTSTQVSVARQEQVSSES